MKSNRTLLPDTKRFEEEAELTEHSPELNSIEVEAASQAEAAVTPEIEAFVEAAVASGVETVTAPQLTTESAAVAQHEAEAGPKNEMMPDAPVAEPECEPGVNAETDFEVVASPGETSPEPEPDAEAVNAEPAPESTVEPAPETVLELDPIVDPRPAAEMNAAEDAASAENEPENIVEDAAVSEAVAPEAPVQEPPSGSAVEDTFEQVTEQQVTVENVSVDEVPPQAESAMEEDSAPESASPVSDEMVEPAIEAVEDKIEEPVVVTASEEADPQVKEMAEEIAAQAAEPTEEEPVGQTKIIEIPEQITGEFVDQAVEQPMELNHPNSEPANEQERTAETASPLPPAEQSANAPEAPTEEPAAVDDAAAPAVASAAAQHPSKPFIKLEAKEGEANASPFSVIVSQVYDGPLDLLLDLIRKQDIDIYDIPIARITAQFLAYVNQLKASDVDVAGEFIYTASLLIHIKSKMLLPRAPSGPDDAAEDPRRELVERLLEHERFKNAAQMLQQKQMLEAATWTNPGVRDFKEDVGAEPEIAADTVDLVRVFREILERARNRPVLNVEEDSVTVGQMIQFLSRRLSMEDKPVALRKLLSHSRSERALIAMFLALLELVRLQAILLRQDLAFSEIFIKKHSNFESVMTEGVVHDDWK